MLDNDDLFDNYDLLLPSKFEGGYLIVALYGKIKSKEIGNYFTTVDIKLTLDEISSKYGNSVPQTERIIKNLLHFFLRNIPNEPGKYYLTDHAESLVELLKRKLQNPYKHFPLKQNFEKYFTIGVKEIQGINDLERKFGREFVSGHKRIINDHLKAFEDDLIETYNQLNSILQSDEQSATQLIKRFASVFKTFGERAEDISNAIISKDKFLRNLRNQVDRFYGKVDQYKHPETPDERDFLAKLKNEWTRAVEIYNDIDNFFQTIDYKISNIRRQIINASEKLSELHEDFSSRSQFRIQIKRLLKLTIDSASYDEERISFSNNFPVKEIIQGRTQLFFPEYYDFGLLKQNLVVQVPFDSIYEQKERSIIEKEIKRQEIINGWIEKSKLMLNDQGVIQINDLIETIVTEEEDFSIAYQVAIELTQYVSESEDHSLSVLHELTSLKNNETLLWKMKLQKISTLIS